ncbi:ABC transporter permease [Mesorhizobium sangaii]|uniref:NitT/TauT family transport system permease protein n=1 Tax=Mesorhizobium sangaii TaxID=505389 RepID=A0A841PEL8_9HYPH|nr:ABC transporter permease [Mesorhizobium sangaii]MBB6413764.1 NitT/TauT family transport system permease protein [Mesorhizobium sangaii]
MSNVFAETTRPPRPHLAKGIEQIVPPALILIAFVVAWEFSSVWFGIPKYLFPAPSDFIGKFVTDRSVIAYHFAATGYVAVVGFAAATLIAIPLGLAIASYSSLRRSLFPLIVFFEIIPKTITAPLLIVWFGFGFAPRIGLVVIMTFFPILVNSIAGFSSLNPRLHLITKSMGANSWQTFRFIRFPSAMPYIFSGMKIGMVYAVTACITAEFIGANEGLEVMILTASSYMDISLMFAGVIATAMLAMLLTGMLLGLEKAMMPWRRDQ